MQLISYFSEHVACCHGSVCGLDWDVRADYGSADEPSCHRKTAVFKACEDGQAEMWFCAVLLAVCCSALEFISLRFGWTTLEYVHSLSGIVIAPAS